MQVHDIKFRISEIFFSIQGEGTRAGLPCIFVRLQGCNMNCSWCDTRYAIPGKKGTEMTGEEIIRQVSAYNCRFIEFTGGEPLFQENVRHLIKYYCDSGYTVAVETNGHYDISAIDPGAVIIMDIKCPASKMVKKNNYNNIRLLGAKDELKFVIADSDDFNFAIDLIKKHDVFNYTKNIIFSPVFGSINPEELAELILSSGLELRMQIQMHKIIWHPDTRGV